MAKSQSPFTQHSKYVRPLELAQINAALAFLHAGDPVNAAKCADTLLWSLYMERVLWPQAREITGLADTGLEMGALTAVARMILQPEVVEGMRRRAHPRPPKGALGTSTVGESVWNAKTIQLVSNPMMLGPTEDTYPLPIPAWDKLVSLLEAFGLLWQVM